MRIITPKALFHKKCFTLESNCIPLGNRFEPLNRKFNSKKKIMGLNSILFSNIKISTQAEYSTKFGTNYYPKKYETMSINAVKRARESIATKQKKEQDEMLDI